MKNGARQIEGEDPDFRRRGMIVFGLEHTDRLAGQLDHLESTDDPSAVVNVEPARGGRIEIRQPAMEDFVTVDLGVVLEPAPQLDGAPRALE